MKHCTKKFVVITLILSFSSVPFCFIKSFASPLLNYITSEKRVLLHNEVKKFNEYLVEGNYEKAKMFIEPRYRKKWFEEKLNETEPITFLRINTKKIIPYQQVMRVSDDIEATINSYYGEEPFSIERNGNWFYEDGHWYLSNMALFPLVAITSKNPIFTDKDKEIKCKELTLLIYECQDKIEEYSERYKYYTPKAKVRFDEAEVYFYLAYIAAFKKRTTPQERKQSDEEFAYYYSAGWKSMRIGGYYLDKAEKKYLPLLTDTIEIQNEYAKQLFELKNISTSL